MSTGGGGGGCIRIHCCTPEKFDTIYLWKIIHYCTLLLQTSRESNILSVTTRTQRYKKVTIILFSSLIMDLLKSGCLHLKVGA